MRTFAFFFAFLLAFVLVTADNDERDWVARLVARNNTNNTLEQKDKTKTVNAKMTFYGDGELKNAACYGRDGLPEYDAKPTDFIGAMKMKNQEMCYQCLQIKNKKNNKKVVVKIIDECSTCEANQVDVTKKVFSKLADPDLGVVKISWKPVPCPSKGSFPTFEDKGKKDKKHN